MFRVSLVNIVRHIQMVYTNAEKCYPKRHLLTHISIFILLLRPHQSLDHIRSLKLIPQLGIVTPHANT